MNKLREWIREQEGATLSEVLVAELIGGIVLTAAAAVMMISFNSSARVNDKINAASQGRNAIELTQQRLRSQTCMFPQEFSVNSVIPDSGGQRSFVHANPSKMIFIGDIGGTGGSTAVAGSVGYRPQLRYIWFDAGPTTGRYAGRRGKLMEGWKNTTNTTIPFNFNLSPLTGAAAFDAMASTTNANSVTVTGQTVMAEGVTNEVTSSNVAIPVLPLLQRRRHRAPAVRRIFADRFARRGQPSQRDFQDSRRERQGLQNDDVRRQDRPSHGFVLD